MPMTAGTNQPVTRSARRWIGAFEPCARSTRLTIWARVVSRPTRSARMTNEPLAFIVAPMTRSPAAFSTGSDSPVSIDSSTAEAPSMTTPSTGTRSPGRTRTRSPTTTCVDRHLALAAVAQHARGGRAQLEQRLDGAGGLALGARLEPSAQQHEADDHRRRVEVRLVAEAGRHHRVGHERDDQRVAVGGQRADRHERVHVRLAVARAARGGDEEPAAEDELDDRGGDEEPAVDRPPSATACRPART